MNNFKARREFLSTWDQRIVLRVTFCAHRCVWNSSHRIRQKSDLSIATAIISRELWKLKRTTVLVVTPLVAIMKDHVEEMIRLGLKAFGIGLGENDQNVICFQARLMSTLTLFMVVQRVGVLPSGRKH